MTRMRSAEPRLSRHVVLFQLCCGLRMHGNDVCRVDTCNCLCCSLDCGAHAQAEPEVDSDWASASSSWDTVNETVTEQ